MGSNAKKRFGWSLSKSRVANCTFVINLWRDLRISHQICARDIHSHGNQDLNTCLKGSKDEKVEKRYISHIKSKIQIAHSIFSDTKISTDTPKRHDILCIISLIDNVGSSCCYISYVKFQGPLSLCISMNNWQLPCVLYGSGLNPLIASSLSGRSLIRKCLSLTFLSFFRLCKLVDFTLTTLLQISNWSSLNLV